MEMTVETSGWQYCSSELDGGYEFAKKFKPIFKLWNKKRGDAALPSWKDFEFEDFIGWHEFIILTEVNLEPFDLHYRIYSSFASNIYNKNFTGKTMRSLTPTLDNASDINHYERLQKQQKIGASFGPVKWPEKDHMNISMLDLPLSADGRTVTHFLSCIQ